MKLPRIWNDPSPEHAFLRICPDGSAVLVDRRGDKLCGGNILAPNGNRCKYVNPEAAANADLALDHNGRWDADQCIATLLTELQRRAQS